ncbi:ATP-binding protein [Planomonospora venezuelensis]|uniref:Anti-sigma regulatory factor (Ser/Thr protein kinase) n=1 Tax=Planomonospora venezuelensis TaxID=1999 RepID=A0A841D059_PLAVE|nr:ATP-binding protein [Planomonospora venezuelensis]MBB5961647.1 anti-sigma regulatory factor (Ser/Thr protein kinase) [Planomonospora venezuelensis]GIM98793.1 ATP-binding protein [Planomonospora venezuelensis]
MNAVISPGEVGSEILGEAYLRLDPASASQARTCVREWLGSDHPAYENVRLATSELVTNAAVHADRGRACDLVLFMLVRMADLLLIEVTDPGGALSRPRACDAVPDDVEGGRGLAIVRELSGGRWGVRDHGTLGRTVWCALDLHPAPAAEPCA